MTKKPHTNFEILMGPMTLEGALWKGVSACLLEDKKTGHICVVTAPDEKQLQFFWKKLTDDKLNISMTKTTIGNYEFIQKQEMFWYYDRIQDFCFFGEDTQRTKGVSKIGVAERKTIAECRILLRKLGWDKEDILSTTIQLEDDIPF